MSNVAASTRADERHATHAWLAVLPALVYAAAVFPFIYRNVPGEIDISQMAFAIIHGQLTGLHEAAGYHYGYPISFGYYYFLYHLAPGAILSSSTTLISLMNAIGFCAAVVAVGLLGLYLSRLYGLRVALITTLIFAFSPMFLELGTYGHPELPAFCLLLLGAYVLTFDTNIPESMIRRALVVTTAAAAILAALCVRSDVILALPFIAIAGRNSGGSLLEHLRAMLPRIVAVSVAALGFFILQHIALASTGSTGESHLVQYLAFSDNLSLAKKGLVIIVLGSGIASILLCAIVLLLGYLRGLRLADIAAIGSLIFLSLVLWLPNPAPPRHFLFLVLAVALVIGIAFARRISLLVALAIGILTPVANQALGELLYPTMVAHYDWNYPPLTERRVTRSVPLGFFVRDHRANQYNFTHLRAEGTALAKACENRGRLLVFADEPYYYLMALAERDPTLQLHTVESEHGARAVHAHGRTCETAVVSKYMAWPRDVVPDFLGDVQYRQWPVYFQESTRSSWDKTEIPEDRVVRAFNPSAAN
jgi:hypothetical protein